MSDQFDQGYPPSPPGDLDPGPAQVESLEDADIEREREDHFEPEGRRPEGSPEDEDRRLDAHDAEEVADTQSRDHLGGGRGPQDRPNFNDNVAEWSREP